MNNKQDYVVIRAPELETDDYRPRYKVVRTDNESEVLDNAQGWGYKSREAAHKAYNFKKNKKSLPSKKRKRQRDKRKSLEYKLAKKLVEEGKYATVKEAEAAIDDGIVDELKDGKTQAQINQQLRKLITE